MNVQIRPFRPEDYPAINAIGNAIWPEYPDSVEEMRYWDEHRDPKCKFQRWVAERDGHVVGAGNHDQWVDMYHPRKFVIYVGVHPDHQGQGIGSALYDQVVAALQAFDPLVMRAQTREDKTRSIQFLRDRGFREEMRSWESRLDVAAFDPAPYAGVEEQVRAQGIEIRTIKELESDPERDRKLYELEVELDADVPRPDVGTPVTYEWFVENRLKNPDLIPEAYFVALHNGEYVAMSNLWSSQGNDDIYTGLTATKRAYRRRGIALALKLRGIAYARSQGRAVIKTWNESNNRPMLSINERLGYVKQPAWIGFVKVIKAEEQ